MLLLLALTVYCSCHMKRCECFFYMLSLIPFVSVLNHVLCLLYTCKYVQFELTAGAHVVSLEAKGSNWLLFKI